MTRPEWIEVVQRMVTNWPHVTIPDASIAKWYGDLAHLPFEQVAVAVEAIYRDGREYPPNGAQVLAKVSELSRDDPDYGEAWRLVNKALRKFGVYDWPGFYSYLEKHSPAVCEAARRYGFEPSGYLIADQGTVRAQFRDIFRAVCAERQRADAYSGLPDAGLRQLQRGPRQLGDALRSALPKEVQ